MSLESPVFDGDDDERRCLLEPREGCHPYSGLVETGHTQRISQHHDAVNPTDAPEQLSNKLSEINPLLRDEVESQFTTVPAMKNITKDEQMKKSGLNAYH